MRNLVVALLLSVFMNGWRVAAQTPTFTVLHRFNPRQGDGFLPEGGLAIGPDGTVYGTTGNGGTAGHGTVFALTPPSAPGGDWTETVLYSFKDSPDGNFPMAGLALGAGGVLYGTTTYGGAAGKGTVFSLSPPAPGTSWAEAVLWSFGTGSDGANPAASLTIGGNGQLFGTTPLGGGSGFGCVFALRPPASPGGAWSESLLWSFDGASGQFPQMSGVTAGRDGILYGSTGSGGADGQGTVFSLTPPNAPGGPWTEAVLWNFAGGRDDGRAPEGNLLIAVGGVLYGTTNYGGEYDQGTVFSLSPPASPGGTWTETILHRFPRQKEKPHDPLGFHPMAGVLRAEKTGALYGTTWNGGQFAEGVLFRLDPPALPGEDWHETVLRNFVKRGGKWPYALSADGGVLYGATAEGGAVVLDVCDKGCGTVFALQP
jgi:uncharacterized repeat protein (TIGR03803 family)